MRACLIACLPLALLGCRGENTDAPSPVEAAQPTPPTEEQQAQLVAARDALMQRLGGRLTEAMAESPSAAIGVCADEAVPLTRAVAEEHGVRMGRTSHRLRNPGNTPPAWAAELLADLPAEDVFLTGPGRETRAFLPIKLQDRCIICHGDADEIPDLIRPALEEHYPDDEATGFSPGDIRGYVWVESE